jgi:hypothetical protein
MKKCIIERVPRDLRPLARDHPGSCPSFLIPSPLELTVRPHSVTEQAKMEADFISHPTEWISAALIGRKSPSQLAMPNNLRPAAPLHQLQN